MRMRVPVILTCLLAVVLAAMPVRQAKADGVSFDVFYNNLADDGDWYNTPDLGYVWHPTVADKSDKWRPYTDGYWAQTDDGWTWVSYENFGWATYHYGRWTRLKDIGWSWVPGYDWGPGWVSWRTDDDHVGWAPLPPRAEQGTEEGRPVERREAATTIDYNTVEPADYGPDVDVQYDIGPENYCFVETRHFGAPVLAEVILPPQQNFVIIERTVNVTNIYRPPGGPVGPGGGFVVFNRGPDFNVINARCERPIQVLRIEQHTDVTYLNNGIHGGGNANQVRGGVFSVAAPPIRHETINFTQVKPVRVKQTIERTEVVHGWSNGGADPATVQRLRQQFKQQAQQAPPPPREPNPPRPEQLQRARAEANQPPAPANTPAERIGPPNNNNNNNRPPLTPEEKAARRDARQKGNNTPAPEQQQPGAPSPDRGPKANNREPATPGNPPAGPNGQGLTPEEKAARKAQRQQGKPQPDQQPPPAANQPPQPGNNPDKEARKTQRQQEQPQSPQTQPPAPNPDKEARKAQRQQDQQPQAQPPAANPEKEARKAQRQQQDEPQAQPPAPNPEKEARKAQRQQDQQGQPRPPQADQPRSQQGNASPAKGGNGNGGGSDDDKKKKKDQPNQ